MFENHASQEENKDTSNSSVGNGSGKDLCSLHPKLGSSDTAAKELRLYKPTALGLTPALVLEACHFP